MLKAISQSHSLPESEGRSYVSIDAHAARWASRDVTYWIDVRCGSASSSRTRKFGEILSDCRPCLTNCTLHHFYPALRMEAEHISIATQRWNQCEHFAADAKQPSNNLSLI
jgi:hypothetical protein